MEDVWEGRKYGKMNIKEDYMEDAMRGTLYGRWNERNII